MKQMGIHGFLTAVLVLTAVDPALHAESIYSEYKRKAKAIRSDDPAEQRMMTLWCMDHNLKNQYIRHYRLFLKSRGENARKKSPEGYCRTCNGQGEYVCDVCDTKRRVHVKCSRCAGTGKTLCSRCKGTGKVTCPKCGGSGQLKKTKRTAGVKSQVYTFTITCPKQILCGSCKGKKTERCRVCNGSKIERKPCSVCDKYRFRKCPECMEQRDEFNERVRQSSIAVAEAPPPDPDDDAKEKEVPPADLDNLEGDPLVKKGSSLLAEGLALDKQALTSKDPYPLMKKAAKKYEEAIECYKAARKKGCDVDAKLRETMTMFYWLRKMTPVR